MLRPLRPSSWRPTGTCRAPRWPAIWPISLPCLGRKKNEVSSSKDGAWSTKNDQKWRLKLVEMHEIIMKNGGFTSTNWVFEHQTWDYHWLSLKIMGNAQLFIGNAYIKTKDMGWWIWAENCGLTGRKPYLMGICSQQYRVLHKNNHLTFGRNSSQLLRRAPNFKVVIQTCCRRHSKKTAIFVSSSNSHSCNGR